MAAKRWTVLPGGHIKRFSGTRRGKRQVKRHSYWCCGEKFSMKMRQRILGGRRARQNQSLYFQLSHGDLEVVLLPPDKLYEYELYWYC